MSTFRQKVQAATGRAQADPEDAGEGRARRTRRPRRSQSAPEPRTRAPAQAPVTAHRLFPVFAALWFAALFGLGSLAISGQVLGAIVTAIGLPALVPATAPPLGFTAHLLVAFVLTIAGAALGLLGALRLRARAQGQAARPAEPAPRAAPQPEADDLPRYRARDAHPDAPPRRPLVLTEAFAEKPLDAAQEPALPAADAPLLRRKPGQSAGAVAASEPEPWIPVFTPGGASAVEPLDLASLDLAALDAVAPAEPESAPEPVIVPAAAPFAPPPAALIEPAPAPEPVPTLLAATPQLPRGFAAALADPERLKAGETWSPLAGASLDALGLVQLIERLALAIAARKAASDAGPTPPSTGIDPHGEAEAQAEAQPEPGPFAHPPASDARAAAAPPADSEPTGSAREAILRRLGAMAAAPASAPASIPEAAPLPFSRPQRTEAAPAPVEPVTPPRPVDPSAGPGPFAAPAAKAAPAAAAAEPPGETAVPFETDAALRTALATLQRMTARG